jgi:hypothetical protein
MCAFLLGVSNFILSFKLKPVDDLLGRMCGLGCTWSKDWGVDLPSTVLDGDEDDGVPVFEFTGELPAETETDFRRNGMALSWGSQIAGCDRSLCVNGSVKRAAGGFISWECEFDLLKKLLSRFLLDCFFIFAGSGAGFELDKLCEVWPRCSRCGGVG